MFSYFPNQIVANSNTKLYSSVLNKLFFFVIDILYFYKKSVGYIFMLIIHGLYENSDITLSLR